MKILTILFLITIFSISFVVSSQYSYNLYEEETNYSLIPTVNNSEYFQSYTPLTLKDYFEGFYDLVYQPIGSYLTTWLIPDTTNGYLYNDTTKIYFNDTKLNSTISTEGVRLGFNTTDLRNVAFTNQSNNFNKNNLTNISMINIANSGTFVCGNIPNGTFCRNNTGLYYKSGVGV